MDTSNSRRRVAKQSSKVDALEEKKHELLHRMRLENEQHGKEILQQKIARRKKQKILPADAIETDTEDLESDTEDIVDGKYETLSRLRLHYVRKLVKNPTKFPEPHECLPLKDKMETSFDSATFLCRAIRSSILKGDWNNVTRLLLVLAKNLNVPCSRELFKVVCKLNFKYNNAGKKINIWSQYQNMMNVSSASQL